MKARRSKSVSSARFAKDRTESAGASNPMKVGLFDSVLTMCPTLSRIEKEVLQTRFGSRVVSYAETAQRLGLTADTVCEIELGALQKLRLSSVETRTSAVGGWDEV